MNRSELKHLIKEEIQNILGEEEERLLKTATPIPDEKNRRMFRTAKEIAERLYNKYTRTGKKPGIFGIEKSLQKFKDAEELSQINNWYQTWSKVIKTATTYNDLWNTLSLVPKKLKNEFETKLGNISENEKERN